MLLYMLINIPRSSSHLAVYGPGRAPGEPWQLLQHVGTSAATAAQASSGQSPAGDSDCRAEHSVGRSTMMWQALLP